MELVVDSREQSLLNDLQDGFGFSVSSASLTIGDLWIKKDDQILLLIERKTVADLCASLRDGRYHDQRRRWKTFQTDHPDARISLWIEGDLMGAAIMDDTLRGTLMNSLFRLQSLHDIIVHHVRDRRSFVLSLRLAMLKFDKDPHHLILEKSTMTNATLDMHRYKKSKDVDASTVWRSLLALLPGVSGDMAQKIVEVIPTLAQFYREEDVMTKLAAIQMTPKRRLGLKQAQKIASLLRPAEAQS